MTDTHGVAPPTAGRADAWLHGGDVVDGYTASPMDVPEFEQWAERCGRVLVVRGNHDAHLQPALEHALPAIDGACVEVEGVNVVGVGWRGDVYSDLPGERELKRVTDAARRAVRGRRGPTVLLSHYPPTSANGVLGRPVPDGWCSGVIDELIRDLRPAAVMCGHIHGWAGGSTTLDLGGSPCLLFNPGPTPARLTVTPDGATLG